MLFTPQQIEEIRQIIEDHHQAFVANAISPDALPENVRKRLAEIGLLDPKVESAWDSYLYGQLIGTLENKTVANMSYEQFKAHLRKNPIPLTATEKHAIKFAEVNTAQYCRGLGNRIQTQTGQILIEADAKLRAKLETTIRTETAKNIAARKTVQDLKSELGWASKDWARDWTRIAVTEKQTAMQRGLADKYRKDHGGDVLVAKRPMDGACEHCKRVYRGPDGQPRIFKLSVLEENGTNVGKRTADWLPVVGTVHPSCQCQMVRIPKGWGFDEHGDLVPGGEYGQHYTDEKQLQRALADEFDLQKAFRLQDNIVYQGIPIAIENKKGSVRRWKDSDGTTGQTKMTYAYGYIKGAPGIDDDDLDVFIGPDPRAKTVYVIDQQNREQTVYDEQKVMLGFSSEKAAKQAYLAHYDTADYFLAISQMDIEAFKRHISVLGSKVKLENLEKSLSLVIPVDSDRLEKAKERDAPGPGLGINYFIPQPVKQMRSGKTQKAFDPRDMLPENTGVPVGYPLKVDKAHYDMGQGVPVEPKTVKLPGGWQESAEQVREGAQERQGQLVARYRQNIPPANKVAAQGKQISLAGCSDQTREIIFKLGGVVIDSTADRVTIRVRKSQQKKMVALLKKHGVDSTVAMNKKFIKLTIPKK